MCAVPEEICQSFRNEALSRLSFVWRRSSCGTHLFCHTQEVFNNLDSEENLLAVIMDQPSTSTPKSGPVPSAFSLPASSASSVPAPSVAGVPAIFVYSVPAPSVSMGAYSVNLVVPESDGPICDSYYH